MTITKAKKAFSGFTTWHNRVVKSKYKTTKKVLWNYYAMTIINEFTLEIPSYQTKSGHPEIWRY